MLYLTLILFVILIFLHHFYRRSTEHRRLTKKRNSELERILLDQILYQPLPSNFPLNKEERVFALQEAMWSAVDDFEKACHGTYDIIAPIARVIKHAHHLKLLSSLSDIEVEDRLKLINSTGKIMSRL